MNLTNKKENNCAKGKGEFLYSYFIRKFRLAKIVQNNAFLANLMKINVANERVKILAYSVCTYLRIESMCGCGWYLQFFAWYIFLIENYFIFAYR